MMNTWTDLGVKLLANLLLLLSFFPGLLSCSKHSLALFKYSCHFLQQASLMLHPRSEVAMSTSVVVCEGTVPSFVFHLGANKRPMKTD